MLVIKIENSNYIIVLSYNSPDAGPHGWPPVVKDRSLGRGLQVQNEAEESEEFSFKKLT